MDGGLKPTFSCLEAFFFFNSELKRRRKHHNIICFEGCENHFASTENHLTQAGGAKCYIYKKL